MISLSLLKNYNTSIHGVNQSVVLSQKHGYFRDFAMFLYKIQLFFVVFHKTFVLVQKTVLLEGHFLNLKIAANGFIIGFCGNGTACVGAKCFYILQIGNKALFCQHGSTAYPLYHAK